MFVKRDAKVKFDRLRSLFPVVAVVGARQAGKTTFLQNEAGNERNARYVLFDDPDARRLFETDVKKFETQYVPENGPAILDEVHYCKNAGADLKYLADSGHRLWLTSSSEAILARDVLSKLVGRVGILRLHPFSFPEFLRAKKAAAPDEEIFLRLAWEHAAYGGYPRVVTAPDALSKHDVLSSLFETVLLKDVAQTFSIDDSESLFRLARYLAANSGGILNAADACSQVGIAFSTLKKYLGALQKSHVISLVAPYHSNKATELVKRPKAFFNDTGMRNAVLGQYPAELDGRLFENYVFTELLKAGFSPKYWAAKSGAEVDFVLDTSAGAIPVEAKLSSRGIEGGLRSFMERYGPKKAFVVSYRGKPGREKVGGCEVLQVRPWDLPAAVAKGA